jgi:lipoate-protein ligase A
MLLVRGEPAESAAHEMSLSHALMLRVAAGELPSALRLYRPAATVAFGRLDTLRPGYAAAAEAARRHGYEPVLRMPGGHAAAYHRQSLGIDIVYAVADPVPGTHERFRETGERLAGALAELGVDARVGEVPGEYCPGAYSVNARGRVKLIGTAQRLVRGAALLGATIVVRDGAGVREVLRDVYEKLELDWDEATAGSVAEEVPGVSVLEVEHAVLAAYPDLEYGALDEPTQELARSLIPKHRLEASAF